MPRQDNKKTDTSKPDELNCAIAIKHRRMHLHKSRLIAVSVSVILVLLMKPISKLIQGSLGQLIYAHADSLLPGSINAFLSDVIETKYPDKKHLLELVERFYEYNNDFLYKPVSVQMIGDLARDYLQPAKLGAHDRICAAELAACFGLRFDLKDYENPSYHRWVGDLPALTRQADAGVFNNDFINALPFIILCRMTVHAVISQIYFDYYQQPLFASTVIIVFIIEILLTKVLKILLLSHVMPAFKEGFTASDEAKIAYLRNLSAHPIGDILLKLRSYIVLTLALINLYSYAQFRRKPPTNYWQQLEVRNSYLTYFYLNLTVQTLKVLAVFANQFVQARMSRILARHANDHFHTVMREFTEKCRHEPLDYGQNLDTNYLTFLTPRRTGLLKPKHTMRVLETYFNPVYSSNTRIVLSAAEILGDNNVYTCYLRFLLLWVCKLINADDILRRHDMVNKLQRVAQELRREVDIENIKKEVMKQVASLSFNNRIQITYPPDQMPQVKVFIGPVDIDDSQDLPKPFKDIIKIDNGTIIIQCNAVTPKIPADLMEFLKGLPKPVASVTTTLERKTPRRRSSVYKKKGGGTKKPETTTPKGGRTGGSHGEAPAGYSPIYTCYSNPFYGKIDDKVRLSFAGEGNLFQEFQNILNRGKTTGEHDGSGVKMCKKERHPQYTWKIKLKGRKDRLYGRVQNDKTIIFDKLDQKHDPRRFACT